MWFWSLGKRAQLRANWNPPQNSTANVGVTLARDEGDKAPVRLASLGEAKFGQEGVWR
jgi:hypothetical protein